MLLILLIVVIAAAITITPMIAWFVYIILGVFALKFVRHHRDIIDRHIRYTVSLLSSSSPTLPTRFNPNASSHTVRFLPFVRGRVRKNGKQCWLEWKFDFNVRWTNVVTHDIEKLDFLVKVCDDLIDHLNNTYAILTAKTTTVHEAEVVMNPPDTKEKPHV
jgi:hypothetical protein